MGLVLGLHIFAGTLWKLPIKLTIFRFSVSFLYILSSWRHWTFMLSDLWKCCWMWDKHIDVKSLSIPASRKLQKKSWCVQWSRFSATLLPTRRLPLFQSCWTHFLCPSSCLSSVNSTEQINWYYCETGKHLVSTNPNQVWKMWRKIPVLNLEHVLDLNGNSSSLKEDDHAWDQELSG